MAKKNITVSQSLKIDEIFEEKGWEKKSETYSLYSNYIERFSILPEDTKDLFFDLTKRFDNITTINQITTLFRKAYNKIDIEKSKNCRKIFFLPLIAQEQAYENMTKYKWINRMLFYLNISKKIYIERPMIKSCDKMISFLEMEYRDMTFSQKFIFPRSFSGFKKQYVKESDLIILVDDFIGTGTTASEALDFYIKREKLSYKNNIKILSLISQVKGVKYIRETYGITVLYALCQNQAITDYYGTDAESKKELVKKMSAAVNIKKDIYGYENSEALVSILNKSPNNTIPIFWYETKANPAPFPRMKIYNKH